MMKQYFFYPLLRVATASCNPKAKEIVFDLLTLLLFRDFCKISG